MYIRLLICVFFSFSLLSCSRSNADDSQAPMLINGEELNKAEWPYVVRILTGNSGCSATVVGPKVVITAAHCGSNGQTSKFSINGKAYSGKVTRSALYPAQDHDVAVIILDEAVPRAEVKNYAKITSKAPTVGEKRYIAGYGCIRPGGGGGNDGVLRGGSATITGFSGFDVVSGRPGEAALCFGDSGGPMFLAKTPEAPEIAGINSKGNIRDTNYNLNLASNESKQFLNKIAKEKNVEICGINGTDANCGDGDGPIDPPPPPPDEVCDQSAKKELLSKLAMCLQVKLDSKFGSMYE